MDIDVSNLCHRLSSTDVTKYSLEMQIWWRNHQQADIIRIEKEEKIKEKIKKLENKIQKYKNKYNII